VARKQLEDYAKPRLERMKNGINIPDAESEQLETLDATVKDFENVLYSYRRGTEC
jgi:hypothetical protein